MLGLPYPVRETSMQHCDLAPIENGPTQQKGLFRASSYKRKSPSSKKAMWRQLFKTINLANPEMRLFRGLARFNEVDMAWIGDEASVSCFMK